MWTVVLLLFASSLVVGSKLDPIVSTNAGVIQGVRTDNGSKFIGIRYGVVDTNNPFGISTPQPRFDNIFQANKYVACPQLGRGDIDCLRLNIFVPSTASSTNRLPVLVWVHQGSFVEGSGHREAADPVSLLRNDVIVVSINYRLGPYGFMCLGIPEVPGNQGLKDQVLAFRWINENIESFGGDASQITAMGESSGGISVNLHLYSTYEKLFHRAIIQSGPALSPWVMIENDFTVPQRLAQELGYNTTDVREALAYLATIDPQTLIRISFETLIIDSLSSSCIEQYFEGVQPFLTDHPINTISSKVSSTQIIIGSTDQESMFRFKPAGENFFVNYDLGEFLARGFDLDSDTQEVIDHIRHFYIGEQNIDANVRYQLADLATDFVWTHATQRMIEQFLDNGAPVVYRYMFLYNGGRNMESVTLKLNITGASHADELGYLFDLNIFTGETSPEDQLVVDRITTLWTNFVKFGNPTPETTELLPVIWEPVTKTSQVYLEIDDDIALKARPVNDRMAFWDVVYRLYRNQQKWYRPSDLI